MNEYCIFCHLTFGSAERRIQWGGHDAHEHCFNEHFRKALGGNYVAQNRSIVSDLQETSAGHGDRL